MCIIRKDSNYKELLKLRYVCKIWNNTILYCLPPWVWHSWISKVYLYKRLIKLSGNKLQEVTGFWYYQTDYRRNNFIKSTSKNPYYSGIKESRKRRIQMIKEYREKNWKILPHIKNQIYKYDKFTVTSEGYSVCRGRKMVPVYDRLKPKVFLRIGLPNLKKRKVKKGIGKFLSNQ